MPKYDEMYEDAETEVTDESMSEETEDTSTETAVIPQTLCPGMKPGDKVILRIDEVTDDQYVVSYPGEKMEKEKRAPEMEESEEVVEETPDEMGAMMA